MTEHLTEEQLREWRDGRVDLYAAQCSVTAMELLALRARVAKLEAVLKDVAKECSTFPIRDGLAFRCESIARAALKDTPQ